jgi:hypothetical protein
MTFSYTISIPVGRFGDGRSSIPMDTNADLLGEETVELWLPVLPTISPA